MNKLTKAILAPSLALAAVVAGALWWGTHDCEAPCGLIESLEEKIPPPDLNAYVAYVAATNAERYRRKNGVRPESLSVLVPEYLPRVPDDPFGANAALNYDAARGIVWTVGENGDFNGEKLSGKDSYGRAFKYVINLDGTPTYQPKKRSP